MTYEELLERAGELAPAEQDRLLAGLGELVRKRRRYEGGRDPLELIGFGKEVWRDPETGEPIDAQEYVDRERQSWGG